MVISSIIDADSKIFSVPRSQSHQSQITTSHHQLSISYRFAVVPRKIKFNQVRNHSQLLGPKLEHLHQQLVGREVMDAVDMEDLDRQKRSDLIRDTIMDKLAETGEKDKLKDMLRDRLILSGEKWCLHKTVDVTRETPGNIGACRQRIEQYPVTAFLLFEDSC